MAAKEMTENTYRILFHNQGQIYEVYARSIYQSDLYGFVEVEDYVFGNHSQMLIDPAEDRLRSEFEGVQRSYIPCLLYTSPSPRDRQKSRMPSSA